MIPCHPKSIECSSDQCTWSDWGNFKTLCPVRADVFGKGSLVEAIVMLRSC